MKKTIALLTACALMLTLVLAGCAAKEDAPPAGRLTETYEAVKAAYGDDYMPAYMLTSEEFTEQYGVDLDDVADYIAEQALISFHVDRFVGIVAKPDRAEAVYDALVQFRENAITQSIQYPVNMPRVHASQVVRVGDYVFFILLGAQIPMEIHSGENVEENAKIFCEAENAKAVDAINSILK